MFTGIIEEVGKLRGRVPLGRGARLDIEGHIALADIAEGDSIAVNGVCLTVVDFDATGFRVEAVEETLSKSTIGMLKPGDRVNLERALRVGGKLGGHFVQGHVDFTSRVMAIDRREESWLLSIGFPAQAAANIVPMGSIAIDGVSLTVARKEDDHFVLSIIPHTWEHTLFHTYRIGTTVNIELDILGKYVLQGQRAPATTPITEDGLRSLGY
ncbi:MAG TPA: riboflavin synthase [Bacteroidota bacterium]|nr:riboflavin synthase [Bacteroidota bacterium]